MLNFDFGFLLLNGNVGVMVVLVVNGVISGFYCELYVEVMSFIENGFGMSFVVVVLYVVLVMDVGMFDVE